MHVLTFLLFVVIGTPITIRQIIAEAIFYQSLTQITRDMVEASFEGYATDTNMATVNAFRLSSNALQEAYAIVYKEIGIRQFQTAFLINTINVVSLASGAGSLVTVGRGVAGKLLFSSGSKGSVFFTGAKSEVSKTLVKQKATEFAISRGALTINMTTGGKILGGYERLIGKYFPENTYKLWKAASATFAKNTGGVAHVFQSYGGSGLKSIWATAEFVNLSSSVKLVFHVVRFL